MINANADEGLIAVVAAPQVLTSQLFPTYEKAIIIVQSDGALPGNPDKACTQEHLTAGDHVCAGHRSADGAFHLDDHAHAIRRALSPIPVGSATIRHLAAGYFTGDGHSIGCQR